MDWLEKGLKGKRAVLVGLGRSSVAAARLLLREGVEPFITESADGDRFAPFKRACDALGVRYETDGHGGGVFENAD
ncbi:MAG TPA: UDP-N-acetylmuramoyl-L-alanine--D-glutamate ligase, partial [Candidatus Hydrogenedentes bacterium]|nr:UDP-N-acetylmuramoyl-L-alanine--D-glutamate ligase [Candidatus Hydrogenedentota bacterium]